MVENPCTSKYYCPGICCYNPQIHLTIPEFNEHFAQFHPIEVQPDKLPHLRETAPLLAVMGTQQFFAVIEGFVKLQIVGPCPHLDLSTRDCLIHDRRPQVCDNLVVNGDKCRKIRHKYWLAQDRGFVA